ncbi:protein lifeguard 3-like [Belonocnema kinseyi]|uniref:protein lifeguard 3-like n=1 Tax=Belonocnema kinseyi TaxID=2817044 RepID=UPI00143E04DB|nr:protein lifeguard 3-like [Belonocnema kinseyi]
MYQSENPQSNVEAQVVIGPPLLPALHVGQKIASGPYSITVTEAMVRGRERENEEIYRQWVAQISRETRDNDEYYAEFKNRKVRRKFIRNVFCVLSLLILFTIGIVSIFLFVSEAKVFLLQNWYLAWISMVIFLVVYFIIVFNESARRKYPYNWICLFLLTLSMSLMMSCISLTYRLEVVLSGGITTATITVIISFFATVCSFDLTKRIGLVLIIGFGGVVLLFIVIPIYIFTAISALSIAIGVIGSLLISMYLYFDIQTIMGGREIELRPDEIVNAVTRLYVDILLLFQYVLRCFR